MKRVIVALLALCVLIGLVGCNAENTDKFPVKLVWMNLSTENSNYIQMQVENTGDRVVIGYKIRVQFYDADGKVIQSAGEDYDTVIQKNIQLQKGYKTDRDNQTFLFGISRPASFKAAVFECTYENGGVSELADSELEWKYYPDK